MFCEKCGKENPAEAKFCEECGAVFEPVVAEEAPAESAPVESAPAENPVQDVVNNVKAAISGADEKVVKIGIIAGAVAVVLILLAIFGAFQPASLKALKKLNKAGLTANAKAYYSVIWSPYTEQYSWEKDEKNEAIEEMKEEMQDEKTERKEDGTKISFKNYKVTKKYKKSEVNKIADYAEEHWDYDVDEFKLQAVQVVKCTMVEKEDGDTDSDTEEAVMIKVKGKWYLDTRLSSLGKNGIKNSILKAND